MGSGRNRSSQSKGRASRETDRVHRYSAPPRRSYVGQGTHRKVGGDAPNSFCRNRIHTVPRFLKNCLAFTLRPYSKAKLSSKLSSRFRLRKILLPSGLYLICTLTNCQQLHLTVTGVNALIRAAFPTTFAWFFVPRFVHWAKRSVLRSLYPLVSVGCFPRAVLSSGGTGCYRLADQGTARPRFA